MKTNPTFPPRMGKPRKHAGSSSIAPGLGVIAGASAQGSHLDELTSSVIREPLRVADAVEVTMGAQAMGGGHPAPPRGGENGRRGPKEFSRLPIHPPSISGLTKTVITIPLRTERGQNAREHWAARHRRVADEKQSVGWCLLAEFGPRRPWPLPLVVTLTRGAPSSGLDDDNLVASLKTIRDAVADWLGVDDKHRDLVRYRYAQERASKQWFVRIEFAPMPTAETTI